MGAEPAVHGRDGHLGGAGGRALRRADRLHGHEPVPERAPGAGRRLSRVERPGAAGRHRAAGLAVPVRRRGHLGRQLLHRHRRQPARVRQRQHHVDPQRALRVDERTRAAPSRSRTPATSTSARAPAPTARRPASAASATRTPRARASSSSTRSKEQARGQLPNNTWLQQQLTANMNINQTCNAFWNGSSVNFYRSGRRLQQHRRDRGRLRPRVGPRDGQQRRQRQRSRTRARASPTSTWRCASRSPASAATSATRTCGGYGNPCLTCTGVRDIDWDQRALDQPHDHHLDRRQLSGGGPGPCGGEVHCEGYGLRRDGVGPVQPRPARRGLQRRHRARRSRPAPPTSARARWATCTSACRAAAAALPARPTSTSWRRTTTTATSPTARPTTGPSARRSTATASPARRRSRARAAAPLAPTHRPVVTGTARRQGRPAVLGCGARAP